MAVLTRLRPSSQRQVSDLSRVARRHGLDMLGFLLDMAQMEAEERVRHGHK